MLVYYFVPFIASNRYLLFWVSNGHNSVTVQNRTHVCMNFFDNKDLGNHLLQLCPKVVKHPVYIMTGKLIVEIEVFIILSRVARKIFLCGSCVFWPCGKKAGQLTDDELGRIWNETVVVCIGIWPDEMMSKLWNIRRWWHLWLISSLSFPPNLNPWIRFRNPVF